MGRDHQYFHMVGGTCAAWQGKYLNKYENSLRWELRTFDVTFKFSYRSVSETPKDLKIAFQGHRGQRHPPTTHDFLCLQEKISIFFSPTQYRTQRSLLDARSFTRYQLKWPNYLKILNYHQNTSFCSSRMLPTQVWLSYQRRFCYHKTRYRWWPCLLCQFLKPIMSI